MERKDKPVNVTHIYIRNNTQVYNRTTKPLETGATVFKNRVYEVGKFYVSAEKTRKKEPVKFKITDEDAIRLIEQSQAVAVVKGPDSKTPWIVADIFGKPLKHDYIPIVLEDTKKAPSKEGD